MSAPELPVVPCWIDPIPERQPAVFQHMYEDGDLPALAVPDALWEDRDFVASVRRRAYINLKTDKPPGIEAIVELVKRELRARAGGAE